jgi:hypothetical protein
MERVRKINRRSRPRAAATAPIQDSARLASGKALYRIVLDADF